MATRPLPEQDRPTQRRRPRRTGGLLVVGMLLAGGLVTVAGEPGARAATPGTVYVLAPASPATGLEALLFDAMNGFSFGAGSAQLASTDGRYLVLADGSLVDRTARSTFQPDLTSFVGPGAAVTVGVIARGIGTLYSLEVRVPGASTFTSVVVDAASGNVTGYRDRRVTGLSPNGRYVAFADAIVDRTLGRAITAPDPTSTFGSGDGPAVADDGSHVRVRAGHITVEAADGTVLYEPVEFADTARQSTGVSDDFRIGVVPNAPNTPAGRGPLVTVADHRTGERIAIDYPSGTFVLGPYDTLVPLISADGNGLVLLVRRCDATGTSCFYVDHRYGYGFRSSLRPVTSYLQRIESRGGGALRITGHNGVRHGTQAALLNIAVTDIVYDGYLTVWSCDGGQPLASNVNYRAGSTMAGAVVASLDLNGRSCIYSHGAVDLVVDVLGTFGRAWSGTRPQRLLDTRETGSGDRVSGVVHLPVSGDVVALNVAAVDPVGDAFVTVWPCAAPRPLASNVNVRAGDIVSNVALVATSPDGAGRPEVCLFASRPMHLVVDGAGSALLEPAGGVPAAAYEPRTPTRVLDSRLLPGANGRVLAPGTVTPIAIHHLDGRSARSGETAVLNVTAVDPAAAGFLTVYPCDEPRPLASNLNHEPNRTVANLVLAKVGSTGDVCVFNQQATDVVVDLGGIVPAGPDERGREPLFVGMTPTRAADTRLGIVTS